MAAAEEIVKLEDLGFDGEVYILDDSDREADKKFNMLARGKPKKFKHRDDEYLWCEVGLHELNGVDGWSDSFVKKILSREPTDPHELHKLVKNGDTSGIIDFFEKYYAPNVNKPDDNGLTPLCIALSAKKTQAFILLAESYGAILGEGCNEIINEQKYGKELKRKVNELFIYDASKRQYNPRLVSFSQTKYPKKFVDISGIRGIGGYFEHQNSLGCGKHAMNNLLGKPKFIEDSDFEYTDIDEQIQESTSIVIDALCRYLQHEFKKMVVPDGSAVAFASDISCPASGYYDITTMVYGLSKAGYHSDQSIYLEGKKEMNGTNKFYSYESVKNKSSGAAELSIGYIINVPGHWVSIKIIENSPNVEYYDSMQNGKFIFGNLEDCLNAIIDNKGEILRSIEVFGYPPEEDIIKQFKENLEIQQFVTSDD